ncbi:uncharacterized protein [Blastocystis hominis]|uniref:Uncharacterized protein n=1 Tax=Blastocystis hominis TaxID=12968 RepID=D8LZM4_BLAHO|nr:uncharacterized protein [Blastocystis hominis]CBK21263.2 unnamed protein product [Blastocystis hominis]|eukprot:XP_012895311.1 uncharacterized protein [Blastocystis hominis]
MSSKQIGEVQDQLYKEMYEKFVQLIAELTNLVDESQRKIVEYKSNLETSVIPQSLVDEFLEQRRVLINGIVKKVEEANCFFPIIDFVDKALDEVESSLNRFEEQCTTVFNTCQDRRPKKGFSLFNKKEQSGTDVPPPIWVHPDYIFNADAMITQMKQIRDISEAGMHSRLHDASPVCSNKQIAQQTTPSFFLSFFLLSRRLLPFQLRHRSRLRLFVLRLASLPFSLPFSLHLQHSAQRANDPRAAHPFLHPQEELGLLQRREHAENALHLLVHRFDVVFHLLLHAVHDVQDRRDVLLLTQQTPATPHNPLLLLV